MTSQEISSLELRIEKAGAIVYVPITSEQRDEIVKQAMYLLWGRGVSSAKFEASKVGQEEAALRTELFLMHNGPDDSSRERIERRLDGLTRSERHHLAIQFGELEKRYSELTEDIAALDKDLDRSTDSEWQLKLRERKKEKEDERDGIVARMSDIEKQLSRLEKADENQ